MSRTSSKLGRFLSLGCVALLAALVGLVLFPRLGSALATARPEEAATRHTEEQSRRSAARSTNASELRSRLATARRSTNEVPGLVDEGVDGATNPLARPPRLHERAEGEWQGMLIDLNVQALCGEPNGCGLAQACLNGHCGPCSKDADCSAGEACVLDHCVASAHATCRTRHDCAQGELCALSGYSPDPRGNSDLKSYCLADKGGSPQDEAAVVTAPAEPEPQDLEPSELLESVRSAVQP